jgi:large subunit ribosomal protein L10
METTTGTTIRSSKRVRPEKVQQVEALAERFQRAQALVFTDFRGLSAGDMVKLRRELKKNGLEYTVVKNRLAKLAAEKVGLSVDSLLEGPTGICFGYDDPALAFKLCAQLAKQFEHYKIKGGIIEGQLVDAEGALEMAKLPTRQELLAQLAGAIQGPIRALALTLSALLRDLVVVLSEVAKVKPEPPAATTTAETAEAEEAKPAEGEAQTGTAESERAAESQEQEQAKATEEAAEGDSNSQEKGEASEA